MSTSPIPTTLLDTDILSEVLKQNNRVVVRQAADYLTQHGQFSFSAITYYEVLRGLRAKNATRQLQNFAAFCQRSTIYPLTQSILDRTADLWVTGTKGTYPHRDADLFIAATALEHGLVLATGNTKDFVWVPGLTIVDWR